MPGRFATGWLLACSLAYINALPARHSGGKADYGLSSIMDRFGASANDYDFEDFTPENYVKNVESASHELSEVEEVSSKADIGNYSASSRRLEPDAEMLPAHYTGVKPPGVDHMEMTMMDSASLGSNRKNSLTDEPKTTDSKTISSEVEKGFENKETFEKSLKGEKSKNIRKVNYADAGGKKKSRGETKKHIEGRTDESNDGKRENYEIKTNQGKGRNAAGYRNVYHKDEHKKDADFYDNDRQTGSLYKHGHYDEDHVTAESDYRKGVSNDSSFAKVLNGKKGQSDKQRVDDEVTSHGAKSGYGGFLWKQDEFEKNIGGSGVRSSGKGEGPATKVR